MRRCYFCGKILNEIPYKCRHCANYFCSEHHLPENHNCQKINFSDSPSVSPNRYPLENDHPNTKSYPSEKNKRSQKQGSIVSDIVVGGLIIFATVVLIFLIIAPNFSIFMESHNIVADSAKQMLSIPTETTIEKSQKSLDYINDKRVTFGKSQLIFDVRLYNLAKARAEDLETYGYFDSTNPITGSCAWSMKSTYGINNNENVVESLYNVQISIDKKPMERRAYTDDIEKTAIDSWMSGKFDSLNPNYPNNIAGAIYCSKNSNCVFLGLNHDISYPACFPPKK